MTSKLRKTALIAALLAGAFALSSCGGGGDSGPSAEEMAQMEAEEMAREAASAAIAAATAAAAGLDGTSDSEAVVAASAAILAARTAIEKLPEGERSAATAMLNDAVTEVAEQHARLAQEAEAARKAAEAEAEAAEAARKAAETEAEAAEAARKAAEAEANRKAAEAEAKAMAAAGKALRAALAGTSATTNALDNLPDTNRAPLTSAGLAIAAVADAGTLTGAIPAVTLKAGESAGALGSWNGVHYAHVNPGTKVSNAALVYNNKGAATSAPFSGVGGKYTSQIIPDEGATQGHIELDRTDGTTPVTRAVATAFVHSGIQTHDLPKDATALTFRGTYDGAPGEFRCSGTAPCTSTNDGKGSPSALGGTWHFKPDVGAMAQTADTAYLYYGWWLSNDKNGDPTAASAFTGVVGTIPDLATNPLSATGSATYSGNAAGKFAMSNPLDGTGSAGHFTANAMLTAKFGANAAPNNGGVSGTIDNFRLNDGTEDPGWSVSLNRAVWSGNGAFTSTANPANTTAEGTVWSINGNSAPESGEWSGQAYDELPGTVAAGGDGSNIATTVTGQFYSEFSTIGRMVGAFGADKQ